MTIVQAKMLIVLISFAAISLPNSADEAVWHDPASPYRLKLSLDKAVSGPTVIELSQQQLIDALGEVAVDIVDTVNLPYDRLKLIDPATGETVGGFKLVRQGKPFEIDGDFSGLRRGESPWLGYTPDTMRFERGTLGGETRTALIITKEKVANQKLQQTVSLTPGHRYLLEYWIRMDMQDNLAGVMLYDPDLALFAQQPHSYINKMPPRGRWERRQMLFRPKVERAELAVRPDPEDAYLRVTHAFVGTAGVADLRLQEVAWELVLDADRPVQELELYAVARAGHHLTAPTPDVILDRAPASTVDVAQIEADRQDLNPEAVLVESGGVRAWTIANELPLKLDTVAGYAPDAPNAAPLARVDLFRGGAATLVIAVDAGEPRLDGLVAESDLPIAPEFHRLATIPVYDGPTVDGEIMGKSLGTRYEAMVPLDYALDPNIDSGIHLITATFTADAASAPGTSQGSITLTLPGDRGELNIPVELRVAPLTINPARYFGTDFGGSHFLTRYREGHGPFTEDGISLAEFHGLTAQGLEPPNMIGLSIPDNPDSRTTPVRRLAEKYFHKMIDFHVLPESPALYAYFKYDVVERGEGQAPALSNWDFSGGYDDAIDELVIGRDMPWLVVGRSNGYLMDRINLANGKTYSTKPNPDNPRWVQLPKDQFLQLAGDYWDAFAQHLDEKGVLDRAMFVIDECGAETYETILEYAQALDARPYAAQIKIGHTMYKPSAWIYRTADGDLLMDKVLDVPMPDNDDEFNFFEPEWNARLDNGAKDQWVYYVETDHMNLQNAGLSTIVAPLKLQHFGADGWYCWASFIWSIPYPYKGEGVMASFGYKSCPVINPWLNPFYHHGPGQLSFFYPPDPRGPAEQPTDLVIPSYRLTLMRDGIQLHALIDVLRDKLDREEIDAIEVTVRPLWADNPTQWYLNYQLYREGRRQLYDAVMGLDRE